jgi:DNA-binding NarL/FixJ family response regulator
VNTAISVFIISICDMTTVDSVWRTFHALLRSTGLCRAPYVQRGGPVPKIVLIADDNPLMRKTLCHLFEQEEQYELCAEACDGAQAVQLAQEHNPDLIILDLSMPVVDGLQAARKLRKLKPGVPLILFTQYSDSYVLAMPDLPFDAVVCKSDGATLMDKVRALAPV